MLQEFVPAGDPSLERKASVLQSLEHYAPRKGTLVFEGKSKVGGAPPPAAIAPTAAAPAPAPEQKARRLSLSERIAKLESEVMGTEQAGGSKTRLEALEKDVLGEAQQGSLGGRVAALEEAV